MVSTKPRYWLVTIPKNSEYVGLDLQDILNKIRRDVHGMLYPQRSTHGDSLHGIFGGNFLVISWDPLGDLLSTKDYKKMSRTHGVNHVIGKTEHFHLQIYIYTLIIVDV